MAHGGTEKYYNPANKVVNDGDTAFANDLNDVNYAVDIALAQVADDLDVMDVKVTTLSAEAESWAHNDQGIPPDPLEPTEFSSKAYATESREYAIQAEGVPIHKADGTTQVINSALVSATKAAASQVSSLASKNAAALSESNAEAHSLQAWADQQAGFESMQDAQAAAAAAQASANLAASSAANLPNATTAGADKILTTNSTGDGWVYPPITLAGKAILDDADAAAQRVTLGLGNVDNTSDVNKPVSTSVQTALNLKANLDSPSFSGNPLVPTQAYSLGAADSSTKAASTAYVNNRIAELTKLIRGSTWLQMFPSGLLVQVGISVASSTAGDEAYVTFSQPFTGNPPFVLVSGITNNFASNTCWVTSVDIMSFKFRATLAYQGITWLAFGYSSIGDDV